MMTRHIFCLKLNQELEGLDKPPLAGPIGEQLFQTISKQAWQLWIAQQTMLINEYRLNVIDPKAREFLLTEMQKFLFTDESTKPAGFTPEV